jgi:MFS transporter, DHA2 family, multidrug resistance protein
MAVASLRRYDVSERGMRRLLIVLGVMAASMLQSLDSTITNVALPTIQGNLGASQDEATWVITAYVISAIVVIPLTPWLQNRFGRKNYFVASIVGFTLASVACGSSESLTFLILSRAVQGAFGGGLVATGQSILRDTFPPEQLGTSQGLYAIGAIMGPALGPPLGGYLVDNWSWNWCFDINIAPGIFAALILFALLRDPERSTPTAVDFPGLGLLAIALGSMQFVLTEGEQHYWLQDSTILLMTIVCVLALGAFIYHELFRTRFPVVDLRILRNHSVWAGSVLALSLGVAALGSSYVLPQFTQGPLGFTPQLSGLLFLLRALPIALCTPLIVRVAGKVDPRYMLGFGFCLIALANYMQASITTLQASFWTFALPLVLSGLGSVTLYIPMTIAVLGSTTPHEGPKASAFINLSLQLGGSISVAMLDVFVHQREEFHSTIIGGALTGGNFTVQQFLAAHSLPELANLAYTQSTILSYADASMAIGTVAIVCIPLIFLMRRRRQAGPPPKVEIDIEMG